MPRNGNVMAFMPFEGIGIFDAVNFLIGITYNHRLFTGSDALFGASRSSGIGALGPAFGIADPTVHGIRLGSIVGEDHGYVQESYREDKTEQQQLLHGGTP